MIVARSTKLRNARRERMLVASRKTRIVARSTKLFNARRKRMLLVLGSKRLLLVSGSNRLLIAGRPNNKLGLLGISNLRSLVFLIRVEMLYMGYLA